MRKELPITTAPKDGRKVTVVWIDDDDQRNESVGQYRSLDKLKAGGGDWDETDTGWWIFTDPGGADVIRRPLCFSDLPIIGVNQGRATGWFSARQRKRS